MIVRSTRLSHIHLLLQLAIDQITEWTEYNNMSLNVKKTKELRISFFKKPVQFDNLILAGTEINLVDNFKLGRFSLEHPYICHLRQSH